MGHLRFYETFPMRLCAPKEPREARAGKRREGGEGAGRGREGAAVDTSYVVGQDFRPTNQ